MKTFNIIFSVLAVISIIANAIKLDFKNLLEGESIIALIGIIAACIVMLLLLILDKSKRIEKKLK